MKIFLRATMALLFIALLGALWLWRQAETFLNTPPQQHGEQIYFDVAPSTNLAQIAQELQQKGLITDARKFAWLARYKDQGTKIQAGRFLLNSGWQPEQVLETLVNGMPVLYRITIPEGLTWWQTARLLESEGLARYDDFAQIIRDPEFLRHYGIPFTTAEGFLMPDTYLLKKPETAMPPPQFTPKTPEEEQLVEEWRQQAKRVAGRMIDNFWRKTSEIWPKEENYDASASSKLYKPGRDNLKKWVTLASIVEEETGVPAERPRVAGVYENRLAKKMLLQADPTVMYGLGPQFVGKLRKIHLEDPTNPYNTYYFPGLPPGPIASFGIAALQAAIKPEKHKYLFFVATGNGDTHTFTSNFADHSDAVREYRRNKQNK